MILMHEMSFTIGKNHQDCFQSMNCIVIAHRMSVGGGYHVLVGVMHVCARAHTHTHTHTHTLSLSLNGSISNKYLAIYWFLHAQL